MLRKRRSKLTPLASALRTRSTDAEKQLWRLLRNRNLIAHKFRRQVPIGAYIADFICIERQLIIELDGGQHLEQTAGDRTRTNNLEQQGFKVLRFWNDDVLLRGQAVLEEILRALNPPVRPSP
jgi:very-short-patch-repair endonuclease